MTDVLLLDPEIEDQEEDLGDLMQKVPTLKGNTKYRFLTMKPLTNEFTFRFSFMHKDQQLVLSNFSKILMIFSFVSAVNCNSPVDASPWGLPCATTYSQYRKILIKNKWTPIPQPGHVEGYKEVLHGSRMGTASWLTSNDFHSININLEYNGKGDYCLYPDSSRN